MNETNGFARTFPNELMMKMGDGLELLNLILLVIAIAVFWKLRSVLGKRTGNERQPYDPYTPNSDQAGGDTKSAQPENDKVVSFPTSRPAADSENNDLGQMETSSPLAQKLTEISLADRNFEPNSFLSGARSAHEMIVTAFANGDRETLKPLLSPDVYESFEGAIAVRENEKQTIELYYVGLTSADLVDAELEDGKARVTVKFVSEQTSCTRTEDGVVVQGDPVTVRSVTDVWTFERSVKARDPNWALVATDAG